MSAAAVPSRSDARELCVAARFAGATPGFANGGVIAGSLVDRLGGAASGTIAVRLWRPVPLDTGLDLHREDDGIVLGRDGQLLATARPDPVSPPTGRPVGLEEAVGSRPLIPPTTHPAPGCFVCGPLHPAGLALQPGAVAADVAATVWRPPAEFADGAGRIPSPIVWAALDCPSWYGAARGRSALLGAITGRQFRPLLAGTPVVVTGWRVASEGRKTHGGAAIRTPDGRLVAAASTIWIHPKEQSR
jgi:hypothetical protein